VSKFDSKLAEALYEDSPDDSIGSVDELGWAGIYRDDLAIIVEDYQGFVWLEEFDTRSDMEEAWEDFEAIYEEYDHGLIV